MKNELFHLNIVANVMDIHTGSKNETFLCKLTITHRLDHYYYYYFYYLAKSVAAVEIKIGLIGMTGLYV